MIKSFKEKLCFYVVVFVLCVGLISSAFLHFPVLSANAQKELSLKTDAMQYDNGQVETQDLNNGENYNYSKTIQPKFTIINLDGELALSEEIIVYVDNLTIFIPNFDYYKIVDRDDNTRFYQADTAKEEGAVSPFAYIGIFLPSIDTDEENFVMYIQYGVAETLTMYNIKIVLDVNEMQYFDAIADPLILGDDEVSSRLKASAKAYHYGAYKDNLEESAIQSKALNYISPTAYDSYTNSDGIIHSYVSSYLGDYHLSDNRTISDDPIVRIIPKDLCFVPGEHFYIGKEYGFFIRVVTDRFNPKDYATDVFVFDIYNSIPSFPSNVTGTSRIEPLFQYKYRAADRYRRGDWNSYDPSLTRVVFPHVEYDYAEYYLNNIGFRHSLFNPTLLNPGDSGYDPYQDDGAFIIQMRYNSRGVGLKKKKGSFAHDTLVFGLGFIPYVGHVANLYSYTYNLFNGFGSNQNYFYNKETIISDNEANIQTNETNNTDQINKRGNLVKSQTSTQNANETSPRLIHVGGGYSESKYVVARRSGSSYNQMHVVTSISANILEDNTYRWLIFFEKGSIVDFGRATGTYERSNYRRVTDATVQGSGTYTVNASNDHQIIKYVPDVSGAYRFESVSSYGDPNFCVHNVTTKVTTHAADDLNGASNRNARLDINLIAGNIYYIEAFSYNSNYGYPLRIGYVPTASTTISRDAVTNVVTTQGTYKMYKFIPTTSGNYDVFTSTRSGDPYLYLLDVNGALLSKGDDELGNLNALLTSYLYAKKTYFIAAQGYKGGIASFDLKVVPSIKYPGNINLNQAISLSVGTYTNMYAFTAPYTDVYDIFTFDKLTGDPYLELYDSNRNMIAQNDDGNGDLNAKITINLTAGQKYYVHVRSYSNTATSYKLGVSMSTANRTDIFTSLTSSASVVNVVNQVKVYKFTAQESRYYTAYTKDIVAGDPYIELMSTARIILATDNNGAGGMNAKINFYLNAGETVYIIARGSNTTVNCQYNLIIN